ncbi:MAG: ABC transporter ATP-binding protein [Acidobacteria bacterium]|nr:ABC transporter ATP-binding protein [Acidobacteriota bacterium]
METKPVIELSGLEVCFGQRTILKDLRGSFSGRAIGLLGPNGAGKSTLINTLMGFYPPSRGTARVFGYDIRTRIREVRRLIGYMPENESFIAGMSAVEFVRFMAELAGLPPEAALERAHESLFYVGLGEARYRKLEEYSLGMKQLAKLAQAIAHGPKLLFLDEPTNGLDPPARQRMIRLIRDVRERGNLHLILCSHLLRDVEECCEEALILKDGRIVQYSNLEEERRANRRFLELELEGDREAFVEAARELGCECALSSRRRLKTVLAEGVEVRDLYRAAAERGARIRRLSHKRDSLEDIFLKAMSNGAGTLNGKSISNGTGGA